MNIENNEKWNWSSLTERFDRLLDQIDPVGTVIQSFLTLDEFKKEKGNDSENWAICNGSEVPKSCRYLELNLDKRLNAKDGCTPDLTGRFITQSDEGNFQQYGEESINANLLNVQMTKNLSVSGVTSQGYSKIGFYGIPRKGPNENSVWALNWDKMAELTLHTGHTKTPMPGMPGRMEDTPNFSNADFIYAGSQSAKVESLGNGVQKSILDGGHTHPFSGQAKKNSDAFQVTSQSENSTKPKHINLNFFIRVN